MMESMRETSKQNGPPKWLLSLAAMMLIMVIANGIMVWNSLRGHRDLVRPDYYDAGLDQDGIIERANLAGALDVSFLRDATEWQAETLAEGLQNATCKVLLYRPDNLAEDTILDWGAPRSTPEMPGRVFWKGPTPNLRRGHWEARLVWEVDGKAIMEKPYHLFISG